MKRKIKKMTRKTKIKLPTTPVRVLIIRNVRCWFSHWDIWDINRMTNEFLLAHTHPNDREKLVRLLIKEIEEYEEQFKFCVK